MDDCTQCLMLKEVRKLKIEQIRFTDSEGKPAYCRACYQRERAENKRLKKAVEIAVRYLKEWRNWYKEMGKHQQYDFGEKLEHIDQALQEKP